MTTSVRLDGEMFVVRINGCQHNVSRADAESLRDQLIKATEMPYKIEKTVIAGRTYLQATPIKDPPIHHANGF